jgi:hypothetical protein
MPRVQRLDDQNVQKLFSLDFNNQSNRNSYIGESHNPVLAAKSRQTSLRGLHVIPVNKTPSGVYN